MGKSTFFARFELSRRAMASVGVILFGLVFHFGVTNPTAAARKEASRGMQRLSQALNRQPSGPVFFTSDKAPESLFGNAFTDPPVPPSNSLSPQTLSDSDLGAKVPLNEKVADPALLKALQVALREKRDAEYISRLRRFRRTLAPINCPPLPSYSLKNLTQLSDSERYIASCHEQKQLQARCVIPSSIFKPMFCPDSYRWDISEQWQEEERKWLAERTSSLH